MVKSYRLKIVVVGEPDVGKTSIIKNFVEGAFPKDYIPTIGANFFIKNVFFEANQEEYECQLGIWDIAGQIAWSAMRSQYYKGADGVFVLGDLTQPRTFEQIDTFWVNDIRESLEKVPMILLANKVDLITEGFKLNEKKYLENHGFKRIIKTSAKTGENIQLSFQEIIKSILNIKDLKPLSHLKAK